MGLFLDSLVCSTDLFLYQYCAVLITVHLQYSLISESMIPPTLFCFLSIGLAVWSFVVLYKLGFFCSTPVKNFMGILIETALNL